MCCFEKYAHTGRIFFSGVEFPIFPLDTVVVQLSNARSAVWCRLEVADKTNHKKNRNGILYRSATAKVAGCSANHPVKLQAGGDEEQRRQTEFLFCECWFSFALTDPPSPSRALFGGTYAAHWETQSNSTNIRRRERDMKLTYRHGTRDARI